VERLSKQFGVPVVPIQANRGKGLDKLKQVLSEAVHAKASQATMPQVPFPAPFELSEADSMMGQPLPDRLLIEARLDSDGDPTTRPPTDPKARLDKVKTGRTDLRLILKRP